MPQERTNKTKQTNKQTKQNKTNKQTHKQSAHDGDGICWERLAIRNLPTFLDPQGPLGPNLRKGTFYMGTSHKMGKKKQFLMESNQKTFLQMAENQLGCDIGGAKEPGVI